MSAAEDDTELRDLLIQNLENSGTLNRLKAEMRAAVFLSMGEQDKLENKTPLVNENLKKCLNSRDGRLVASLIMDFLQVFHLDFSLAVFQPEVNWPSGPDSREQVCKELGLPEAELNQNSPLLLELVRRGRHTVAGKVLLEDGASPPGVTSTKQPISCPVRKHDAASGLTNERLDVDLEAEPVDNHDDGDSFFDDPLPKPQKTYGWKMEAAAEEGGGGSASELSHSHPASNPREKKSADPKNPNDRSAYLDDEVEYDDDFNSHRSDLSKSELSIGEEIEEVSIEGPENSEKFDETQDVSVSQLSQTHGVDYMEEVS